MILHFLVWVFLRSFSAQGTLFNVMRSTLLNCKIGRPNPRNSIREVIYYQYFTKFNKAIYIVYFGGYVKNLTDITITHLKNRYQKAFWLILAVDLYTNVSHKQKKSSFH